MNIRFEPYGKQPSAFGARFEMVRAFLLDINRETIINSNFLWPRWEWAKSIMLLFRGSADENGLWFDGDRMVALAANEDSQGSAFFILRPGYEFLKPEMLRYASEAFQKEGKTRLLICDADVALQELAAHAGYCASQKSEKTSVIDLTARNLAYSLPEGFHVRSLADGYDVRKLDRCTYRGFGNGDEPPQTEENVDYQGPNFDTALHTVVEAPNGDYAAYAGTWYDRSTDYAYVEPVCTDPLYRKMGCARAALYAGLRRCAERGAKRAYVISQQQFYYKIGFAPRDTYTWWEKP